MKISTVLFWVTALLLMMMGILYLVLPIMPQFAFAVEQVSQDLSPSNIIIALVSALQTVIGLNLLAVGLLAIYAGFRAWQDRFAWTVMLLIVFVYIIPIAWTMSGEGIYMLLVIVPAIPHIAGLVVAATRERAWDGGLF
ncbi:MAG: hypothetical protein SCJ94_07240 [Bacillota bacterium]|nr:hypothetical protein [Bacillota bacterium]